MKKELIQLLKGKNAYIQTHDFPDPDALATAFALQEYLKYYGIEATICYEGKLERASAIRMLDNFGIQVKGGQTKGALPEDACVVLVDSQNQNSNVTDIGGQKSACIDHHPVHHECEYAYRDIRKTGAWWQRSLRPILWKMESYRSRMLPQHLPMRLRWILRILPGERHKKIRICLPICSGMRIGIWYRICMPDTLELADLSAYGGCNPKY